MTPSFCLRHVFVLYVTKVCMCKSFCILNVNSSKLCMLAYYHMVTAVWSDYFWRSYCPFWEYFINFFYPLLLHFKWKLLKTLHSCLWAYQDLHILRAVWLDNFWKSYCPFWLRIFHQKEFWMGRQFFVWKITFDLILVLLYPLQT